MKPFMFLGLALFILIGVILFAGAMQASDYEVSQINGTPGEDTNQTGQMIASTEINYAWWGALALIIVMLSLAAVLRMF